MKKFFTLICALVGFVAAQAATIDDVAVCKHSIVINCGNVTGGGAVRPGKGNLFGAGFFLDVTGGSVATNKGTVDLAAKDADGEYKYLGGKYADEGSSLNCLRLKNAQDVIAMKVTAGSKLIFILNGNAKSGTAARYPKIATDAALNNALNAGPTEATETTGGDYIYEWTAPDDYTIYIGSYNGDMFLSFIIVEANEAPGTPSVKVADQAYDSGEGLWYRTVTCKPVEVDGIPTCCTYTTDGTEPTADSEVYKEPLKIYENCTVKFQAFMDYDGVGVPDEIIPDAVGEAVVEFAFDAPTINVDGANVTLVAANDGATNYYKKNDGEWIEGDSFTLDGSATVTAKSVYANDGICEWESKTSTKDVYVLDAISEKVEITASGDVVLDEEATTDPEAPVYKVENGVVSAPKNFVFVKSPEFAVVKDAAYQVDGKEVYIKMNNTNITFLVADGDSVDVTVTTSLNSCKTIGAADKEDGSVPAERQVFVNVDGTNYGGADMADTTNAERNIIKFGLNAGIHTFKKYSGTGNIMISSIVIEPASVADGIKNVNAASAAKAVKAIENGQLVIKSAKGTFSVAGAQMK